MSRSAAENPPPPPQKNRAAQNLPHLASSNGQRQRTRTAAAAGAAAAMTLDSAPCGCSAPPGERSAYDNYDIPRSLGGCGGAQQQLVGQTQGINSTTILLWSTSFRVARCTALLEQFLYSAICK